MTLDQFLNDLAATQQRICDSDSWIDCIGDVVELARKAPLAAKILRACQEQVGPVFMDEIAEHVLNEKGDESK